MKNKLPEGWKEVELGDVLDYEQPTDYIVASEDYAAEYETPVLTAGKSFILGYTDEKKGIYNKLPVIIFDDFTVASKYVTFPFKVKSSAMKLLTPKTKDVDLKYIFWLMQTIKVNSVSHKRYYLSKYQHIRIPLPPLPTQQKIVSILEKAEQAKEMRKEADELTKDFLKAVFMEMFGDPVSNKKKFLKDNISRGAKFQGGFAFKSNDYQDKGIKLVKITNVHYGHIDWEDKTYVPEKYQQKYSDFLLVPGDIVMAMTRPIIKSLSTVKIVEVIEKDIPCLLNQRVGRFIINTKELSHIYLRYFCLTDYFLKEVDKYCSTSLQPNVSSRQIENIEILYPPLPLQHKFASIVKEVESMKEEQKHSKEQLDNLFNILMQKAFKGELLI